MIVHGIEHAGVPASYRAAKRIILNAMVYGGFVGTEHELSLLNTVVKPEFIRLDLVEVRPDFQYFEQVRSMVRPGYTLEQMIKEVELSNHFISQFQSLAPDKVFVHPMRRFVPVPMIIVDDKIFFGHYSHCPVSAPNGFWMKIKADVEKLRSWYRKGRVDPEATGHDLAAYRLVYECMLAIDEQAPGHPV